METPRCSLDAALPVVENLQKYRHVLKPETTGTKPPERNHRNDRNDRNKKRPKPPKPKWNTEFHLLDPPALLLSLSTCYNVTCISRAILRIYVIVTASVEDMEKLNETKLYSFQICMKTVQFVY